MAPVNTDAANAVRNAVLAVLLLAECPPPRRRFRLSLIGLSMAFCYFRGNDIAIFRLTPYHFENFIHNL